MTAKNPPTLEEWRGLYAVAARVKELAPWLWMTEDQIFGVQNPETSEIGFVSVMGMLGEHFSIAVYPGPKALYRFWDLVRAGDSAPPEQVLEIPQLQASFEDRDMLRDKDREIIKQLGLKFRGKNTWPLFRSYRPGFFPWYVEAAEARFLAHALEQTLDVTPRLRDNPALLTMPNNVSYLVRVPQPQAGGLVWEDHIMEVLPPATEAIPISMDRPALKHLRRLPRRESTLEIDLIMLPSPIQEEKDERPVFPYSLLIVDAPSSFILGQELLIAETSLEEMWGRLPMTVARQLSAAGLVPREIHVRSPLMFQLLQPLADELHITLKQARRLRAVDQVQRAMSKFMRFG